MTGDRLIAVGGVIASAGAALAGSYWIYSLQANVSFWSWPGVATVIVAAVGLVLLVVGFFLPSGSGPVHQTQRGGRKSTNYQAGRDLTIGGQKDGDE